MDIAMLKKGVDYIGVSVVFFCHDGNGNVLMAKRNSNSRDEHNRWDFGGGAIEYGVTVEETLKKEINEEYLCDIKSFEFLGFRDVHRKHNNTKTHWIALDFKVLIDPLQVKNGEPHKFDEVKFFPFEQLPSPLHSQIPYFLELYKDKLFKKD